METGKTEYFKALNKVQGTLGAAKKDSKNPHFGNKYASLSAVNDAVMGPLTEAGFVLLSGGVDINGKPYLRTTLHHIGGHSESFDYPLIEKRDNPQHVASSVTYARRYSICALLNLDVEDDDGNAATPKPLPKAEAAPQAKGPFPSGPVISEAQGKRFYAIAKGSGKSDEQIDAYLKGAFAVSRSSGIPKSRYEEACKWAEAASESIEEVPF